MSARWLHVFSIVFPLAAAVGCATPTSTSTSPTGAPTSDLAAPDPEVVVLRERVARLEKRLVEVDSKLSLLLARADASPPSSSSVRTGARPLRFDRPREQQPIDLDSQPVPEGLASIDIGTRGGDPSLDGPPIVDSSVTSDDGETVTIRMRGEPDDANVPAHQGGVGGVDVDDPLAGLTAPKEIYDWAMARMKEARFTEALAGFEEVVGRYPSHDLADNALYWTGQCHQQKGDHRLAIDVWQKLPLRYPKSPKVPDALYGTAVSHEAVGEPVVAEALYDEVVSSYPKAEKRKDAQRALARLRPR